MALFEIVCGDFERARMRVRYSEAGRAHLRLTSPDGIVEDVFLDRQIAGVAESGEGRVGEYLARWAERDGFADRVVRAESRRDAAGGEGRCERLFVVLLRDGRKFVACGSAESIREIKAASLSEKRRTEVPARTPARPARAGTPARLVPPRFFPDFISRLLPLR